MRVLDGPVPWLADLRFAYNEPLVQFIGEFPGCKFDAPEPGEIGPRRWLVPIELLPQILEAARESFGEVITNERASHVRSVRGLDALQWAQQPHKHQLETAVRALEAQEQAWLINHDMRVGKSGCAIVALRALPSAYALIMAPRMACEAWAREIIKFWPEAEGSVCVWHSNPTKGEKELRQRATIHIVSYGLLGEAHVKMAQEHPFNVLVADEIHYLQNSRSARTRSAFAVRNACPDALRLGLTGTIISTHVESMHQPLEWLWPGRFGTLNKFKWRYMQHDLAYDKQGIARGHKYWGSDNQEELKARLAACSSRLVKSDPSIAHLFPPYDVELIDVEDMKSEALQLTTNLLTAGHSPCIMSYLREDAEHFSKAVSSAVEAGGVTVALLSGDVTAKQRDAVIEDLRKMRANGESVAASATISATKVGVSLSCFTDFIYTDLSDSTEELMQSICRGHEMQGSQQGQSKSTTIYLLVSPDTRAKAERVADKLAIVNMLMKAGTESEAAGKALEAARNKGMSDEEFKQLAALAQASEVNTDVIQVNGE